MPDGSQKRLKGQSGAVSGWKSQRLQVQQLLRLLRRPTGYEELLGGSDTMGLFALSC